MINHTLVFRSAMPKQAQPGQVVQGGKNFEKAARKDAATHEATAIDAAELKQTPCYAYIQGNCTAGKDCSRLHKKQDLESFLVDQLAAVRKL